MYGHGRNGQTSADSTWTANNLRKLRNLSTYRSMINTEVSTMQEVIRRASVAQTTIQKMEDIWKIGAVSKELKLRIVRSTAFVMASYRCEVWTISKECREKCGCFLNVII